MLTTAKQRHTSANRAMRWLATHLIQVPVSSSSPNLRIADKLVPHAHHCKTTSHECKQGDAVGGNAPDSVTSFQLQPEPPHRGQTGPACSPLQNNVTRVQTGRCGG